MRPQRHKVKLELVKAEELKAEIARREQQEFSIVFSDTGPLAVDLMLYPPGGPYLKTPVILYPDGTWKYA